MSNALMIDAILTLGFGVQHSLIASVAVKKQASTRFGVDALAWRSVESLLNVLYILVAAMLWQPVDIVVWRLEGISATVMIVACCLSWIWYWQLHLFEYDCGLAFGSTTFVSWLGGPPSRPKLVPWKVGSRRWIRFPVHTAFFGMFFLLPTMTLDLLVLAVVLNIYNVIGSVLYDKRLEKIGGSAYADYQAVTGLIWPPIYRAPYGAWNITMPHPQHWRRPQMHWMGVVGGAGLGALYYFGLGATHLTPIDMVKVGVFGLLGAILVGLVLGLACRPEADDWGQQQTDLSTTVALSAALGVIFWVGAIWLETGAPPAFAAYLPLWFTVQYVGHVFAVLADRRKWTYCKRAMLSAAKVTGRG
ncbi:hypothetical protein [Bradyrhizobium elkanii]|uniref:hypothetical protein n=1 Tax=Bradyrhizobium elkanii TaxID=29448 RepID=UPI0021684104|nr:hypothetical protein [Bradyrhizobium elkanii]MCS3519254.1 protein-S-isoprenylcysteine O-methyltransferase Ste14 [Bradyrhizobium elkanii]MCS4066912.1 protein-S-isoprenylcysteine O-methyltransferase Ste14 [Bradyrhizobium elkanii]MCS4082447.1 protein-S-isoprenylcysteine O-methyltransferase Ste14 [Bradyrhizobium elkanii]MCW2127939.1 protein-S-isoprenylcysteine O-methyltransferase Ste14 [Bradyrhizobium elkanii]MCW2174680.1 protein-S-isoprenylcysteine O-methyltransferase Ste14 [Bradyrhizobium elk